MPPAVEAQSPNHWTARELPIYICLKVLLASEQRRHCRGQKEKQVTGVRLLWGMVKCSNIVVMAAQRNEYTKNC